VREDIIIQYILKIGEKLSGTGKALQTMAG